MPLEEVALGPRPDRLGVEQQAVVVEDDGVGERGRHRAAAYGCPIAFHVEISAGIHRARVFNLDREDLLAKVAGPWLEERPIEMGDREWAPRESELKILEGPRMEPPDLAFGQGWANAERASENVTRAVLAAAPLPAVPDAFVVEADAPEATVAEMLAGREARPLAWREARERLDGRDPAIAAVVLVVKRGRQAS